jgi:hypothetical protein
MSKIWKQDNNRCDYMKHENWVTAFQSDFEKKLNDRDGWRPNEPAHEPLGGEYAIPLEKMYQNVNIK